ncbi:MAG: hypothetical protein M5U22_02510 [Thermoleophilia bacterium]|nr:hypothetical protein [Thermoleophilia bacterium]
MVYQAADLAWAGLTPLSLTSLAEEVSGSGQEGLVLRFSQGPEYEITVRRRD